MERYILGIDIGTTSVKVLLISESGALAAEGKAVVIITHDEMLARLAGDRRVELAAHDEGRKGA